MTTITKECVFCKKHIEKLETYKLGECLECHEKLYNFCLKNNLNFYFYKDKIFTM